MDDAPVTGAVPSEPLSGGADSLVMSLAEDHESALTAAVGELRAGGLVVLPTDTVYGLAANAFDRRATASIFVAKRRPRGLSLPVLVSRPRQAWALCAEVPETATVLAAAFWPGALTLVLREAEGIEWDLGDRNGTVALRMPHHADLITLLERVGPLACTSANLTGEPTPPTVTEIRAKLGDAVGVYLDGGMATSDRGSTIVDLTGSAPRIIREGAITTADIEAAIAAG